MSERRVSECPSPSPGPGVQQADLVELQHAEPVGLASIFNVFSMMMMVLHELHIGSLVAWSGYG